MNAFPRWARIPTLTLLLLGCDGSDAPPGPPAPWDGGVTPSRTERLFDDEAPVWRFDIEMAPDDREWLDANATLEQYVPGSVIFEGERFENAGIRYKGAFGSLHSCFDDMGRLTCSKLSLKVSFNEYVDRGRFQGVRKLLFHSCNRDPTCLRERLSYRFFGDVGVEASRVGHAVVSINGDPPSLYALVEYVDDEFLEDHFADPEGNLYKERWPVSLDPAYYVDGLRNNESIADVSHMIELATVLGGTDDTAFAADVSPFFDFDYQTRYNAVDQLINDWDGIWKFYCFRGQCGNHNYYIYDDPAAGHFVIIPWDLDHSFSRPNDDMARSWWDDSPMSCEIDPIMIGGIGELGIRAPQCDPLIRGLMRSNWDAYRDALRQILATPATSEEGLLARLDRYRALLRPHVEADPRSPPVLEWDAAVTTLRQGIRAQYREVEAFLAETGPPTGP
jgi:spore coat protein H